MNELLSHEDTLELIKLAKEGDKCAKEELTLKNIALVKSIVRGFLNRGIEYEDLVQIGTVGLLKAIDGYDAKFSVRFSTYAVPMIAGEIKRFLRDDGMVKVSRSIKEIAYKIYKAEESLKKSKGKDPTIEELAEELGIDKEEIVYAMDAVRSPVSLNAPVFEENDNNTELIDVLKDNPEDMVDKIMLKEMLSRLSPREKQLIVLRYFGDKTQSEIAGILGVSQVQVSRLLNKTLEKMRLEAEA